LRPFQFPSAPAARSEAGLFAGDDTIFEPLHLAAAVQVVPVRKTHQVPSELALSRTGDIGSSAQACPSLTTCETFHHPHLNRHYSQRTSFCLYHLLFDSKRVTQLHSLTPTRANMGAQDVLTRKTGVIVGDDVLNLFKYAQQKGFAIPAINVTSSSTVVAALEAARDKKAPIILQTSQGGAAYFAGKVVLNTSSSSASSADHSSRVSPTRNKRPRLRAPLPLLTTFDLLPHLMAFLSSSTPITAPRSSCHGSTA
jgi:hypothetical protein